jgi:hypothetical protein
MNKFLYQFHFIFIFLSDFGLKAFGQELYLWQITSLIAVFISLPLIKIRSALPAIFIFLFSIIGLFFSIVDWNGPVLDRLIGFLLGSANFIIFVSAIFASMKSLNYLSYKTFYFVVSIYVVYFILEVISFYWAAELKPLLSLLHLNERALYKHTISMLGREHSYGSLGVLSLVGVALLLKERGVLSNSAVYLLMLFAVTVVFVASSKTFLIFTIIYLGIMGVRMFGFKAGILGFFVIAIFFIYQYDSISNSFQKIFVLSSASSYSRFYFGLVGLNIFIDNPLFGVGLGGYRFYFLEYVQSLGIEMRWDVGGALSRSDTPSVDANNFYIGILSEVGILGFLAAFLPILFRYLRLRMYTYIRYSFALIVVGAFGFHYWSVSFFPLLIAIIFLDRQSTSVRKL